MGLRDSQDTTTTISFWNWLRDVNLAGLMSPFSCRKQAPAGKGSRGNMLIQEQGHERQIPTYAEQVMTR